MRRSPLRSNSANELAEASIFRALPASYVSSADAVPMAPRQPAAIIECLIVMKMGLSLFVAASTSCARIQVDGV